jgi:dynactin complex subunit
LKEATQKLLKEATLKVKHLSSNLKNLKNLFLSESISTGAEYVSLDNKIKCLSLAVFLLATPPIKL